MMNKEINKAMKKLDKTGKYDEISGQIKLFFILAGQMDVNLLKEAVNGLQQNAAHYAAYGIVDSNPDCYKESDNKISKYEIESAVRRAKSLLKFIELLYETNDKIKK